MPAAVLSLGDILGYLPGRLAARLPRFRPTMLRQTDSRSGRHIRSKSS